MPDIARSPHAILTLILPPMLWLWSIGYIKGDSSVSPANKLLFVQVGWHFRLGRSRVGETGFSRHSKGHSLSPPSLLS